MRSLYVIEIKDVDGNFLPHVGFARFDLLEAWIAKFPDKASKDDRDQWRIVAYTPEVVVNSQVN